MSPKKKVLLLGGLLMDRFLLTESYPGRGEDTLVREETCRAGGCPLNAARVLAALGAEPILYSALGEDGMARELAAAVDRFGLSREALYPLPGGKTGYCLIVLDREGERTFFTYRGCEGHFDRARLSPALVEELAAVFVTGIYLVYPGWSEGAVAFLEELSARGIPVLFDPGSLIGEMDPGLLRRTAEAAAILTPNRWERRELERILSVPDLPAWAADRGAASLETRGAEGAVLTTREGTRVIPPYPTRVVDTTGAGDSFAGGLLAALLGGQSLEEAARTAGVCGALAAEVTGVPDCLTWEAVRARMG